MSNSRESDSARRRQRLLKQGMENLGTLRARPDGSRQNVVDEAVPSPTVPFENLSPAEMQLARQIDARYQFIVAKANHFSILGIPVTATREEVKAAYFSLAKVFHPDRLPPKLSSLGAQMNAIFESIRDAHEVLSDEGKRAAYEAEIPNTAAVELLDRQKALSEFHEGEQALKRKAFREAESLFLSAFQRAPRADFLAAAAWAIYGDFSRKDDAPRAVQMMHEALKLDASCVRAYYQLGVVARIEGKTARAVQHFKEALALNPRHAEAIQELRLLEMRQRTEKKGLF